ncbi:MAG: hypothetical protein PWQ82_1712 [Thermosediminibacterales bacterium]|nr:hypothetical protein [Thermosediminibacterales bacterium]MDK2836228.1 hypothetical protein [Thermosediminibacterales bacterium]
MIYTKEQLDDFLVKVTDTLENALLGCNVKLKDFIKSEEVYGFNSIYTNTDLFKIKLRIPSCALKVEDIKNVYIEIKMNKKSNTDILTNHDKRNDFVKFLYYQHEKEFLEDKNTGIWRYTSNSDPGNSTIRIYKEFKVKNAGLPSVDDVVRSFKILANLDIPTELKKWREQYK